jgi:CO/xanthine dehydrogenase FAD-binding subunit
MSHITEFLKPPSVAEALRLLRAQPERAPLAGGTFLTAHLPNKITGLVDLSGLGLDYVKRRDGAVALGAMTTLNTMAQAAALGPLAALCRDCATQPLRNAITIGGNVMQPLRWSDLPLLLTVLRASFVIRDKRQRTLIADDFFRQLPAKTVGTGGLLTEVVVPDLRRVRLARKKIVRAHDDIPALHVAVAVRLERGRARDVRIAFVAQKPLPTRLPAAEALLEGVAPTADVIRAAAEAAQAAAGPLSDIRFSGEYLGEMLGVHVRRLLTKCLCDQPAAET